MPTEGWCALELSDAVNLAQGFLGRRPDDGKRPWKLREFSDGWLISEAPIEGYRGAAVLVIERDSGRIVRFPSAVPPGRILNEYGLVRSVGLAEAGLDDASSTV
jgi:hypothetical protein